MVFNTFIKCQVCGSITRIRLQVGWQKEHPIVVACGKCGTSLSGNVRLHIGIRCFQKCNGHIAAFILSDRNRAEPAQFQHSEERRHNLRPAAAALKQCQKAHDTVGEQTADDLFGLLRHRVRLCADDSGKVGRRRRQAALSRGLKPNPRIRPAQRSSR